MQCILFFAWMNGIVLHDQGSSEQYLLRVGLHGSSYVIGTYHWLSLIPKKNTRRFSCSRKTAAQVVWLLGCHRQSISKKKKKNVEEAVIASLLECLIIKVLKASSYPGPMSSTRVYFFFAWMHGIIDHDQGSSQYLPRVGLDGSSYVTGTRLFLTLSPLRAF